MLGAVVLLPLAVGAGSRRGGAGFGLTYGDCLPDI